MAEIRIGIVGFGKIAQDQHAPAIAANSGFRFAAVVTHDAAPDLAVPIFTDVRAMLDAVELDAVAICTPPGPRHAIARLCLDAGLHVLLEKPPCATLGQVADLVLLAEKNKTSLFAAWHSRFNDTVVRAAEYTRAEGIAALDIQWREDVEKWHPGQDWIWEKGGFGAFDPGINALSIVSLLCPAPLVIREARLQMHPGGQQPGVVKLKLATNGADEAMTATFDFHHKDGERWTIDIVTKGDTRIQLSQGGSVLRIDGGAAIYTAGREYPDIYARFADLIVTGASDVDVEPLRLVADALLVGERRSSG